MASDVLKEKAAAAQRQVGEIIRGKADAVRLLFNALFVTHGKVGFFYTSAT